MQCLIYIIPHVHKAYDLHPLGFLQPFLWILDSPTEFFVKFLMVMFSGSKCPKYGDTWNLSRDLETQGHCPYLWLWSHPMTFHFKVMEWLYRIYSDFRTSCLEKHRYRHQDYLSSMFLTKDSKNYEHFLLWPFHFRAARGHAIWKTKYMNMLSMSGVCRFKYLDTFCDKIQEKGKKTTGGCNKPLGCRTNPLGVGGLIGFW